jgi:hypothetical protein
LAGDCEGALEYLGIALHYVQDRYVARARRELVVSLVVSYKDIVKHIKLTAQQLIVSFSCFWFFSSRKVLVGGFKAFID